VRGALDKRTQKDLTAALNKNFLRAFLGQAAATIAATSQQSDHLSSATATPGAQASLAFSSPNFPRRYTSRFMRADNATCLAFAQLA